MYRHESPLRVRLRESNVLTSTIYHRNADDSFFLLFTDALVAVQPIFGAVNVAAGLGAAAVGVPLLPFDRGGSARSEEHTSELQSLTNLVCRLLLEKKKFRGCEATHRQPCIIPG